MRETMYQPVEVIYRKVDECPAKDTQFNFFQMVYFISGTGFLTLNGNRLPYWEGNLRLMIPNDSHKFEIGTTTELLLVRFSSSYVKEYKWKSLNCLECILYYAPHLSGCIMRSTTDAIQVKRIVESMRHELDNSDLHNEDMLMHLVNALIVIAGRNISKIRPADLKVNTDSRVQEIVNYVQTNICYPQKLKAAAISREFGISATYLGSYFKNNCGETIQHYISQYKIRQIEHRLKFSDSRINEIAEEFGFSDESHLNKFFKKHKGINLTTYRKTTTAAA